MIQSFADDVTEKIFNGDPLSRRELKKLGGLNLHRAQERLETLRRSTENKLLLLPYLHYHALRGKERYSIDANSRRSKWRITFAWEGNSRKDVQLVLIEDIH